MSDAYKAYSFLHENIPSWIASLEGIGKKVAARETEASKIAVPVVPGPKKTGSTETLKDDTNVNNNINSHLELMSAPQPEDTSPAGARRQQQALLAKRKRKTASVLSDHPSGPNKYRSRNMIVVWYDSEVQKAFETLVRNIGAGRNYLRKGSMAARLEALSELTADEDDNGEYADPVLAKIGYRPSLGLGQYRTSQSRGGFGLTEQKGGQTQFDIADKALEKAQSFCERGAHQFLRDGDCTVELDGCKEAFREVAKLSETEAAKYKAKDEAEKQRKQQEEERKRQQEEEEAKRRSTRQAQHLQPASLAPANGLLEVDDASSDEEELSLSALPPIRMTSRMARV